MENIIQIAGIRSIDEARMLLESGADCLGFPLRLAYHQPDLTEVEAAEIIAKLACGDRSVLITYLDNAQEIASLSRLLKVKYLQLHGFILPNEVQKLRRINPDLRIIKSLIVRSGNMDELRYTIDQFAVWLKLLSQIHTILRRARPAPPARPMIGKSAGKSSHIHLNRLF